MTDTLGPLLVVATHPANVHDSVGAKQVMAALRAKSLSAITKVFADGGYRGESLRGWVAHHCGWALSIVERTDQGKFKVLPKRWVVERTFAWISFQRRTSKDHERLEQTTSEAFMYLAMTRVMLNRLK